MRTRGHQIAQSLSTQQRGGEEPEANPAKNQKQGGWVTRLAPFALRTLGVARAQCVIC